MWILYNFSSFILVTSRIKWTWHESMRCYCKCEFCAKMVAPGSLTIWCVRFLIFKLLFNNFFNYPRHIKFHKVNTYDFDIVFLDFRLWFTTIDIITFVQLNVSKFSQTSSLQFLHTAIHLSPCLRQEHNIDVQGQCVSIRHLQETPFKMFAGATSIFIGMVTKCSSLSVQPQSSALKPVDSRDLHSATWKCTR